MLNIRMLLLFLDELIILFQTQIVALTLYISIYYTHVNVKHTAFWLYECAYQNWLL